MAVRKAYDLWLWLDGRLVDFPAAARPLVGRRISDAAIDLVDALVAATYAPRAGDQRAAELVRANRRLALLKLLVRGACDRHYLSRDQGAFAAGRTAELGRMIGGWLKGATGPGPGSPR